MTHTPHYYYIEKMITTLFQFREEYKGGRKPKYVEALTKYRNKIMEKELASANKYERKEMVQEKKREKQRLEPLMMPHKSSSIELMGHIRKIEGRKRDKKSPPPP